MIVNAQRAEDRLGRNAKLAEFPPEPSRITIPKRNIYQRVIRVTPSFAILAIVGCAVGLLVGVKPDELAVAVAVPLLIMFGISRVLVLCVPRTEPSESIELNFPLLLAVVAGIGFLCAYAAIDFVLSAGVFRLIGMPNLSSGAVKLSGISLCGLLAVVTFLFCRSAIHSLYELIRVVGSEMIETFWGAARTPTRIYERMARQ